MEIDRKLNVESEKQTDRQTEVDRERKKNSQKYRKIDVVTEKKIQTDRDRQTE